MEGERKRDEDREKAREKLECPEEEWERGREERERYGEAKGSKGR